MCAVDSVQVFEQDLSMPPSHVNMSCIDVILCCYVVIVVTTGHTPSALTVFPLSRGISRSRRGGTRPSNTSHSTPTSGSSPAESTGENLCEILIIIIIVRCSGCD